jgi:ABC-type Co2+ transport system permease subunit
MNAVKPLLGIGISVGVLAGIWTYASVELTLITWVAFVAWACFFAAGGGTTGLAKGLAANVAGVFWGWVISQGLENVSASTLALALMVTVVGFVLCIEAALPLLSFIPGGFAGTAVFFGTAFDTVGVLVAIVAGALLGIVSEKLGALIQARIDGSARTVTVPDTSPAT